MDGQVDVKCLFVKLRWVDFGFEKDLLNAKFYCLESNLQNVQLLHWYKNHVTLSICCF